LRSKFGTGGADESLPGFPRLVLWAWERPEDLRFLDPGIWSVAILAKTITVHGSRIDARPRLQPVRLPAGIPTLAVVRIETDPPLENPAPALRDTITWHLLDACGSGAHGLQIDFDARLSERSFYRDLLTHVRRKMPKDKKLSITALASWCIWDDWIRDLPVDEAVPMLFRMGRDREEVCRYLGTGGDFRPVICRSSIGVSTDEPSTPAPAGRRIYLFSPDPWSKEAVARALRETKELR
jgi:hypothetical protein